MPRRQGLLSILVPAVWQDSSNGWINGRTQLTNTPGIAQGSPLGTTVCPFLIQAVPQALAYREASYQQIESLDILSPVIQVRKFASTPPCPKNLCDRNVCVPSVTGSAVLQKSNGVWQTFLLVDLLYYMQFPFKVFLKSSLGQLKCK